MMKLASLLTMFGLFLAACSSEPKTQGMEKQLLHQQTEAAAKPREPQQRNAPLKVDTLKPSELPDGITVRGRAQLGLRWMDANGENVLVETVIPPYDEKLPNRDGMHW